MGSPFSDGTGGSYSPGPIFSDGTEYTYNTGSMPTINKFQLQSGTTRTMYVSWTWTYPHTKGYEVTWHYYVGNDGVAYIGSQSTETNTSAIYTAPSNAKAVCVKIKPISEERTISGDYSAAWFTAKTARSSTYYFKNNPPETPNTPDLTLDKTKLTVSLNNIASGVTEIEWYIVKNDKSLFKQVKTKVTRNAASYICTVTEGSEYKARCRAWRGNEHSEWSAYTGNSQSTPGSVGQITELKAFSDTGVLVDWTGIKNCTSYEVQWTTRKGFFDSNPSEVKSQTVDATTGSHAEVTGLELGQTYFFRVRAVNDAGPGPWSEIRSIVLGKKPSAPTTWSSTSTVIVGEPLILYWVHNAQDNSKEVKAEVEIDTKLTEAASWSSQTYTVPNTGGENTDSIQSKSIDTSSYSEGIMIRWRVRTMGVTNEYGDWSAYRTVNIYARPSLELRLMDQNGNDLRTVTSFPIFVNGIAGPSTQKAVSYYVTVRSKSQYDALDRVGNHIVIGRGDTIFSNYYDTMEDLMVELSAGNIDLESGIEYRLNVIVAMNSGLTAEEYIDFGVSWVDDKYSLNSEVAYNKKNYTFAIHPYCLDENDQLVSGVTLAVYRREFDGKFVKIQDGIPNNDYTFIVDPHPSLDYARYRIVAITESTGSVMFYDIPPYPIKETSIIVQWDEDWQNLNISDVNSSDTPVDPPWSGSLLKLPYNIETNDSNDIDVALVEYAGREHPVTYYGTQVGQGSTWKAEIPKTDIETLYALRRLSVYKGDVYVREPSGTGYWATIKVQYNKKYRVMTIPVTLNVTRVEGGA